MEQPMYNQNVFNNQKKKRKMISNIALIVR